MDRARYPDSVEIDHSPLEYTESTKIAQILSRTLAMAQMGVITGLTISVNNADNTKFDVSPGRVGVPNGEFATVAATQAGLALADNTNGVVNLIIVKYAETEYQPEPSENKVDILNTLVSSSGVIEVLTQAGYDALLPDAQAVREVIGAITATGAAISPTLITQSTPFVNVLAPSQPSVITGVSITAIDFGTPVGMGVLQFDASPPDGADPLVAAPRIRWTAPGEVGPGTYVNIPTNGSYALSSLSGHTLTISVISVNLPMIDQTENIKVDSLYTRPIARFSSADFLHRTYLGSGTPSERNPHALTFEDLGGSPTGQVEEHQLLMHSNGIRRESNSIFLSTAVIPVSGPSPDYIAITGPISGDVYFINGKQLLSITNTQITFLTSVSSNISLYDLIIDEAGNPNRAERLEHPASPTISGVAVIDIDDSIAAGNFNLVYDRTAKTLSWAGGPAVLIRGEGNYTLYDTTGRWVIANVGDGVNLGFGVLPISGGPIFTDSISVFDHVDRTINFLIASVIWDGGNNLGWTEALVNPRQTTDKRYFGNLGLHELRDDALSLNSEHAAATYTVGDGKATFGDFNGATGIQAAINALPTAGGSIVVKAGTYDPFSVTKSDVSILGVGSVVIDGISLSATPGGCVTVQASRARLKNLQLQNAGAGISQVSGNDSRGEGIVFGSGLTGNFSYAAGLRNVYTDVRSVRTISTDSPLTPFDDIVLVDAVAGPVVVTMPDAAACVKRVTIKKKDVTPNLVTAQRAGSDTIDFGTSTATDVYLDALNLEPMTGGWVEA